jgi:hypothetical protein
MGLFRRSQTEPATLPAPVPEPPSTLALALTAVAAAAQQERQASILCTQLDLEQKTWAQRRDRAYVAFCEALKRHADARAALARLTKQDAAQEN